MNFFTKSPMLVFQPELPLPLDLCVAKWRGGNFPIRHCSTCPALRHDGPLDGSVSVHRLEYLDGRKRRLPFRWRRFQRPTSERDATVPLIARHHPTALLSPQMNCGSEFREPSMLDQYRLVGAMPGPTTATQWNSWTCWANGGPPLPPLGQWPTSQRTLNDLSVSGTVHFFRVRAELAGR